jgi:SAM-dependent methyltransferase
VLSSHKREIMDSDNFSDDIRINKRHWDEIAKRDNLRRVEFLSKIRDNCPYLEEMEPKISPYLQNIKGKKIIIPQFGDGAVMLACAKRGAIVTGVDLSSEQVRLAREGAEYCGVSVTLVEADWQHLPNSVPRNHFDLAVAECGIFIWIRDLDAWMNNVYRVLKKNGRLVVTDFHPLSLITEQENGEARIKRSYFDQDHPINHLASEEDEPQSHEFLWKLSDIINASIKSGFKLNCLEEFHVEESGIPPLIPSDFLLTATKE